MKSLLSLSFTFVTCKTSKENGLPGQGWFVLLNNQKSFLLIAVFPVWKRPQIEEVLVMGWQTPTCYGAGPLEKIREFIEQRKNSVQN